MFLEVDYSSCNKDGLCVLECPAGIIEMKAEGPEAIEGAEKICIRCGHCVAVCPEAALSLDFLKPGMCMDVNETLHLDTDRVAHFLTSRRSIRTYRKKEVSRELLERVLELAASAPTGSNRQQVKWIVAHKKETIHTVTHLVIDWMKYMVKKHPDIAAGFNMELLIKFWEDGSDRICRGAPHLIFSYTSKEISSGKADCDTALAYLELALPSFGLGSCWAGYVTYAVNQWAPLQEFLGLREDEQIHGTVMVGYPKFKYRRIPPRNKPLIIYK